MGRERGESRTARIPAQIASALARGRQMAEARRQSHEQGRVAIDRVPQDQEIVTFPQVRECLDTRAFSDSIARHNTIYNQSVSLDWQQADPAEDRAVFSAPPSRVNPNI